MAPIIAIPFKTLSGIGWKFSIPMALLLVIMFFISDFLRRYFSLP